MFSPSFLNLPLSSTRRSVFKGPHPLIVCISRSPSWPEEVKSFPRGSKGTHTDTLNHTQTHTRARASDAQSHTLCLSLSLSSILTRQTFIFKGRSEWGHCTTRRVCGLDVFYSHLSHDWCVEVEHGLLLGCSKLLGKWNGSNTCRSSDMLPVCVFPLYLGPCACFPPLPKSFACLLKCVTWC